MKKLFIISAIAISGLIYNTADAQIRFHVGLRFRPPVVVYAHAPVVYAHAPLVVAAAPVYVQAAPVYSQPAPVYAQSQPVVYNDSSNDDYYYLPDVDAYYDVNDQCYYYYNGASWISAAYLPGAYGNYDWRTATRYEIRAPRPYLHDDVYRSRYNGHANAVFAQNNYNSHFNGGYSNNGQRAVSHPSNQNRDTRGGTEHFVQSSPQNGFARSRMTKF